ncbi:hypothetical protein TRICI_006469 [Trichomonascus ciferrii]|uniref:Uncharacterized protein n=1 Tax=Trichomonascus ciferrii TaxID=44093 RepID=A0A642UGT9_9ASCO|nr:hypothetical protein TRICI_006469 [Trichomonascus ciferrii]
MRPSNLSLLRTGRVIGRIWARKSFGRSWYSTISPAGIISDHGGLSREIDLEKCYDETLSRIVEDNQTFLHERFNTDDTKVSKLVSANGEEDIENNDQLQHQFSNDLLEFSVDGENRKIQKIIRQASSDLNREYHEVKKRRLMIPRSLDQCSVTQYNEFLRSLYYKNSAGSALDYRKLFRAYNALPKPAPFHIEGTHLEDLISLLMDSDPEGQIYGKNHASNVYMGVLSDILECGMPISVREYNSAMYVIGKTISTDEEAERKWPLIEDRLVQLKASNEHKMLRDVSTLNILMGIAVRTNSAQLLEGLVQEFERNHLKPDRFTMMVYLAYMANNHDPEGVRQTYQKIKDSGHVVDITMMNMVFKCLLCSGDLDTAEGLFNALPRQNIRQKPHEISRLTKKVQLMDYLIDITAKQQSNGGQSASKYYVPVVPDYYTYNMFLNYYCIERGNFNQSMAIIKLMVEHNLISKHSFYRLYRAFPTNQRKNSHEWTLERLNYVTEYLCYLQQQSREDFYTIPMGENAVRAYRRLTGRENHTFLDQLQLTLDRSRAPEVRAITVYKTLSALLDTFQCK